MHIDNQAYFLVYPSFKIVQGKSKAVVVDTQNSLYYRLDQYHSNFILGCNGKTINEIQLSYSEEYPVVLDILESVVEKNIGFFTNEPERFPAVSEDFHTQVVITNCLFDIQDEHAFDDLEEVAFQLEDLLCKHLEIRIWGNVDCARLNEIINQLDENGSYIQGLSIIIPLQSYGSIKNNKSLRLKNITIYNDHFDEVIFDNENYTAVQHTTANLTSALCCGVITKRTFSPNMVHFNEAKTFNSCLNQKISVDADGYIKNCPSMKQSFGNIKDTTLAEAIEMPGFKKMWRLNKDTVKVCKDCEFRYICTDCRAYVEDPDDPFSKPLKCGYDPYSGKWSEWATNSLKQKAIDFYGMNALLDSNMSKKQRV